MMTETRDYLMGLDFEPVNIRLPCRKFKAWLVLTDELRFHSTIWPNWWRRFWYWALLGWHWERE